VTRLREQNFGVEIEFTGITRYTAAKVIAGYFGTQVRSDGGYYDKYSAADSQGRKWTLMSDGSILCQRKEGRQIVGAGADHSVELVTPICRYEDIPHIQEIVRRLRAAGGFSNNSCGIHVHVGAEKHTAKTLKNIVNIIASKEALLYQALQVDVGREEYCQRMDTSFLETLNRRPPRSLSDVKSIWYGGSDGSGEHYHDSRYHGLNLHSVFQKGTIEFRLFNSTLSHAGKIKAYIQLCLAISNQALTQTSASRIRTQTDNPKYTFRCWLLRLGLIGDEFKTARQHLLDPLPGNIAWRDPEQARRQRERQRAAREVLRAKDAEQAAAAPEIEAPALEPEEEQGMSMDMSM
jgi:hypothetical protein